jgi:WD40 repeat protein
VFRFDAFDARWSADDRLALASDDDIAVWSESVGVRRLARRKRVGWGREGELAWTHDGRVAFLDDGVIRVWDPRSAAATSVPVELHVTAIAWASDGELAARTAGQLLVWRQGIDGPPTVAGGEVREMAWAPGGQVLAYTTSDQVWLWTERAAAPASPLRARFDLLSWSPDGRRLALVSDDAVYLVSRDTNVITVAAARLGIVRALAWSRGSAFLAAAVPNGIDILEVTRDRYLPAETLMYGDDAYYGCLALSGDYLAACNGDDGVAFFDWRNWARDHVRVISDPVVGGDRLPIRALTWSPDGRFIAASGHHIEVWSRESVHP